MAVLKLKITVHSLLSGGLMFDFNGQLKLHPSSYILLRLCIDWMIFFFLNHSVHDKIGICMNKRSYVRG